MKKTELHTLGPIIKDGEKVDDYGDGIEEWQTLQSGLQWLFLQMISIVLKCSTM
jgi:hypothetical protein